MSSRTAWFSACLIALFAPAAFAAGTRAAASQPATAAVPAKPAPAFVIVKPAPLPKGMEDFKTTDNALRTTIKGARAADAPPEPGYLGLSVTTKDGKIAVINLAGDSPALKAGFAVGDVIVNIDGHVPGDADEFRELVQSIIPGTIAHIAVSRDGKDLTLPVLITATSHPYTLNGPPDHATIGILTNDNNNAITQIANNSSAARAGLRPGDILTQIDGINLSSTLHLDDFLIDHHADDILNITAVRNGQTAKFNIQLDPGSNALAAAAAAGRRGGAAGGTGTGTYYDRLGQIWRRDTLRLAIIGIEYPDVKHDAAISAKNWEDAFFSRGTYKQTATGQVAYGSEADYYFDQSYGALKVVGNMIPWITVGQERNAYSQGSGTGQDRTLLNEALQAILNRDGRTSLDSYDAFMFIYAGPRVQTTRGGIYWPHKSTTTFNNRRMPYVLINELTGPAGAGGNALAAPAGAAGGGRGGGAGGAGPARMTDISVACHESGHILGLPDLYAQPENPGSEGVGSWCVMSQQAGNGRPQCMSAWCREAMGWLHPVVIDPSVKQKLVLAAVEDSPNECYKILVRNDGSEYLLLENRRRKSWDTSLPAEGLLIWRVAGNRPVLEESHGIEGPSGPNSYLSEVPYPTASNDSFTPYTTPSSRSKLGGGNQIYISNIKKMADGRISFWIGYDFN